MTVPVQTPITSHVGNGVSTVFSFGWHCELDTDLVAKVDGIEEDPSGYTVSGLGNDSGGSVTFVTPPAADVPVVLLRRTVIKRDTNYQTAGDFRAQETVNPDFDRIWRAMQDFQTGNIETSFALRVPAGESVDPFPVASDRLDKLPSFSATTGAAGVTAFTATQVASAIAAAYSAGSSTADAVQLTQDGTAFVRSVQDKAREKRSVKDFGAIGDLSAHPLSERYASLAAAQLDFPFATSLAQQIDYCAIQAALIWAGSISNTSAFDGSVRLVEVPEGDYYTGSDTLALADTGVFFRGEGGRGSRIWTDQNVDIMVVGDETDTSSTFNIHVKGVFFDNTRNNNTKSGLKVCRTFFGSVTECQFRNADINLDLIRANRLFVNRNQFSAQRTVIGTAHIRVAALASGNGGGLHIFDNEIGNSSGVLLPDYTSGVLIRNVDGLYYGGNHVRDCAYGWRIAPTGAAESNFINDVMAVGPNYVDNCFTTPLYIGGSVSTGGTYQNIQWIGGLLRCGNTGGTNASYAIDIDIQDADTFVADGGVVRDIKIVATIRQANITGLRARGASAGRIEVQSLDTRGMISEKHNAGGAATYSNADVEIGSGRLDGWSVGADTIAAPSLFGINVSASGGAVPSIIEGDHDLSQANNTGEPTVVTVSGLPANVWRKPNLLPGMGKRLQQGGVGETIDRSPLILMSRTVESAGQVQLYKASVLGVSTSGTAGSARVVYDLRRVVYRQNGSNAVQRSVTELESYSNLSNNDAPCVATLLTGAAWVGSAAVAAKDMITSGGNVYLVQVAGNLDATNPPVHTAGSQANGTAVLGYVSAVGLNTFALIVSGQAATDMSWVEHPDHIALP